MRTWAATGVLVVLVGILLTSPPVIFIGAAIVLVRLLAEIWPRDVLESLEVEHSISPDRTVVGEEVELTLSVWNRSRLPIAWAGATDTVGSGLRMPGSDQSVHSIGVAGPLRPYERLTRRVRVVPMRRGVHDMGPVRLRVAEVFGSHDPSRDPGIDVARVIARPLMAPVVGVLPASAPLAQARARRSLFTDPALFAGTRPFQAGDPVRSIHWRASAREGVLQAKRFEPALSRQAMLVFDVQTIEGDYWLLIFDEALFENLCVAALSVARSMVSDATAVGFAAAGFTGTTQRYVFLPPRADWTQVGRIGDALARLGVECSAPLTTLLAWLPRRVAPGSTLVVLTGRSPLSNLAVTRRLQESGFNVHFLVMPEAHEFITESRTAGLSVRPVRVERDREVPHAVVVAAA
ncbi:MAG: hypothetical protein QOJ81_2170 [Chloroflexota bacterium]|jgi:uncharacterized protein (DUF58 family)|nr:hypothetical protein [Chloroflexota bacterium]